MSPLSRRRPSLPKDLARKLPHSVISVACPHSSLLKPVLGDAADVGNGESLELAAEIERLAVAALVDHGTEATEPLACNLK